MRLLVLLVLVKGDEVDDTYSMTVVVVVFLLLILLMMTALISLVRGNIADWGI